MEPFSTVQIKMSQLSVPDRGICTNAAVFTAAAPGPVCSQTLSPLERKNNGLVVVKIHS